jgi:hypothetical protein
MDGKSDHFPQNDKNSEYDLFVSRNSTPFFQNRSSTIPIIKKLKIHTTAINDEGRHFTQNEVDFICKKNWDKWLKTRYFMGMN